MHLKVNEISRIREKNIRIAKIISQLKLAESLIQPSLSDCEQPEKVLVVDDSEIKIEKYVSPEEEKRMQEQARQEEERKFSSTVDNPRERALETMMGGQLEVNMEEELFKVSLCIFPLCHHGDQVEGFPFTLVGYAETRVYVQGSS